MQVSHRPFEYMMRDLKEASKWLRETTVSQAESGGTIAQLLGIRDTSKLQSQIDASDDMRLAALSGKESD